MPLHYKAIETTQGKVTPSESDLEIIQAFALAGEPINPEDLFIGRMSLANDQYDRSHERFPASYLAQFAATLDGKSVMTGHDYSREPAGRFYAAEVRNGSDRKDLIAKYYLLNSDPLTAKVKAGIARHVSIGFNPDIRQCDLCGKDYDGWMKAAEEPCSHVAGRDYEGKRCTVTYGGDASKVEAVEGSFVWLGCQYGAEALGQNRALSPTAKAAFFESQEGKGRWALRLESAALLETDSALLAPSLLLPEPSSVSPLVVKEHSMSDPKAAANPPEAKLTPEQERLIALGKAYITAMQTHVKSRYGPCGQEKTGDVIAGMFATASLEEIETAVKAADEVFNERFPGKGLGVPMSDQQPQAPSQRKFNPLGIGIPRRAS